MPATRNRRRMKLLVGSAINLAGLACLVLQADTILRGI